jgi:tetratricopeptide (TPR) repeat protein
MDFWITRKPTDDAGRARRPGVLRGRAAALLPALALTLALASSVAAQSASEEPEATQPPPAATAEPVEPQPALVVPESPPASIAPPATAPAARVSPAPVAPPIATAIAAPPPAPTILVAPETLDLVAWLRFKQQARITHLPDQARLFYRRGVLASRAGQRAEGLRLIRGSAELDPTFVLPHVALARHFITREPSQALLQCAIVADLWRQNFLMQLELIGNAYFLVYHAIFFGVVAAAWLVILVRQGQLRHSWQERLERHVSRETSRWWTWALLAIPALAGFGAALPALILLGLLWPVLRLRERSLYVLLVVTVASAPWAGALMGRFTVPLRPEAGPIYGVASLEREPYSTAQHERLVGLTSAHPTNPFLQFGLGWTARRGGDLAGAEAAYRQAMRQWVDDDRLANNLGNVLAMQGRLDEALAQFERAVAINPENAAAYFNTSQVHTRRFDYKAASDAVARASALNFELVRTYQTESQRDGSLPLADQWIAPAVFWRALLDAKTGWTFGSLLPPNWTPKFEASSWPMGLGALLLGLASVLVGVVWNRALPLRSCSNCGRVVCRRCSVRRRETALCPACATVAARADNPDFGRILLAQQRRKIERQEHWVQTALATLVPCYGLVSLRRVFGPLLLLTIGFAALAPRFGLVPPLWYEPHLKFPEFGSGAMVGLFVAVLVFATSLIGYLSRRARERATDPTPIRSRVAQISQYTAEAA